jgi:predicted esterase
VHSWKGHNMSRTDSCSGAGVREPRPAGLAELTNRVSGLVAEHRLTEALELAESGRALAAREPASFALWLAALRYRAERSDDAIREVREAFDRGAFWHPRLLIEHPELAALADQRSYIELVERSRTRWQTAQAFAETSEPVVRRPKDAPRGVLLALHGVTGRARPFAAMWTQSALRAGLALIVPQSPILMSSDRLYGWLPERAHNDVLEAYRVAAAAERLDDLPVVIAGFSQGGGLAADWGLGGMLSNKGFIAVGPAQLTASPSTIRAAAARGIRGCLMAGQWDWARRHTEDFCWDRLGPGGVPWSLDVMPRVGHAVSADFGSRLDVALRFVRDA